MNKTLNRHRSEPYTPLQEITTAPTDDFKQAILCELRAMQQACTEAHRQPDHVLYTELLQHLSAALNELYLEKRIGVGNTLNDKYITVTDAQQ
ncbi:MAG: hypothetical protein MJY71_02495 [Bacteroidaceae bacterium]|nr:hypothetical protein [Bacteroidaceae bacterium]